MAITYGIWSDVHAHGKKCGSYLVLNSVILERLGKLGCKVLPSVRLVEPVFICISDERINVT